MRWHVTAPALAVAGILLTGAALAARPAVWQWTLPEGIAQPVVPADNMMSNAKVALGRRLFYEADLSIDGTMSCATCHGQRDSFTDGAVTHPGVTGKAGLRNVPSLVNVAWASPLTWADPRLATLEDQVHVPVTGDDPIEMGMKGQEAEIARRLSTSDCYRKLFRTAFPKDKGRIDLDTVSKALAAFQRTMVSYETPWDHARSGGAPLPGQAAKGAALFTGKAGCASCHAGANFSDNRLHPFASTPRDIGVARITGRADDQGLFRTPGLRNVALTAPYLHDGSARTLPEAMARHGIALDAGEEADLLAFLDQLTDKRITTDPRFTAPPLRQCLMS
jgi:cytochrome c peroxidase